MKLEIEYKDDEFSDVQKLTAKVEGIRVKAKLRDGVAIINQIKPLMGCEAVYGEWISSAFTLFNKHDSVEHVEFATNDNMG